MTVAGNIFPTQLVTRFRSLCRRELRRLGELAKHKREVSELADELGQKDETSKAPEGRGGKGEVIQRDIEDFEVKRWALTSKHEALRC